MAETNHMGETFKVGDTVTGPDLMGAGTYTVEGFTDHGRMAQLRSVGHPEWPAVGVPVRHLQLVATAPPVAAGTGECERCAHCAEKAEQVLDYAEGMELLDDNGRDTQILDLITHLRHRYDQLPEDERNYASWQDLITSVDIHYEAEVAGEDCDEDCEKHGAEG